MTKYAYWNAEEGTQLYYNIDPSLRKWYYSIQNDGSWSKIDKQKYASVPHGWLFYTHLMYDNERKLCVCFSSMYVVR